MLNNHPVTVQRLRSLGQSAVPGPRVSGAAVPADLWSPALCLRLRLSRRQHTRTADSPDSVPPPLYASSAFKWDSPSGLWWRMWVYFWGELKEELVRRRKAEPGGRIGSFSFSSAPFLLSAGQDSKGRLGETELVWCGSGTFCLARGRAHRLLVSVWSKQELKLVGCVCFLCVSRSRSAPLHGRVGRRGGLLNSLKCDGCAASFSSHSWTILNLLVHYIEELLLLFISIGSGHIFWPQIESCGSLVCSGFFFFFLFLSLSNPFLMERVPFTPQCFSRTDMHTPPHPSTGAAGRMRFDSLPG